MIIYRRYCYGLLVNTAHRSFLNKSHFPLKQLLSNPGERGKVNEEQLNKTKLW